MPHKHHPFSKKRLGIFSLAMINVAAIESLKNLPIMSKVGLAAIFFYAVAGLLFFIPTALVSAELATGWPTKGGVYLWLKQAFGQRWGFIGIWLEWIQNVIWYPTVLSFAAATLAYLINPTLANNPLYMISVILIVYWAATCINLFGMKASGIISTVGAMIGTVIPGLLIIVLGLVYYFSGKPLQIHFSWHAAIPNMSSIKNIVFLVGVLLAMAGMEMSAVHAKEVKNPQVSYPRAILLSVVIILVLSILGSLAIAIVVPAKNISLVAGIMQAFSDFFAVYHLHWLTPILAVLIVIGAITGTCTWIAGPSRGLLATAEDGDLPAFFQHHNKFNMPVAIFIMQGAIVTLLSLSFVLMPSVSSSFWLLTCLTAQLYLIMYALMFAAAIWLRHSQPDVKRTYRVPGGKYLGMWIVAGVGCIASIVAICIGFVPPSQIQSGNIWFYEGFLIIGLVIMIGVPLTIYALRRPSWKAIDIDKE